MRKAFTLVELLVIIAVIGILVAIMIIPAISGRSDNIQYGVGGITETRCIGGFQCILGPRGHVTQLVGADGKPIICVER